MNKIDLFANHLWSFDIPMFFDIKNDYIQEIYAFREKYSSVSFSNVDGWRSPDLYSIQMRSTNLKMLLHRIKETVDRTILNGRFTVDIDGLWYNINSPGSSNHLHHHPGSHLSGIFYINVPKDSEKCGYLNIQSPNNYSEFNYQMALNAEHSMVAYNVEPVEGRFFMFPAHLWHCVLTNETDEDRISLACNINLKLRE